MKVWIEIDTTVAEDAEFLLNKVQVDVAINPDFIRNVLKTKVGEIVVVPCVRAMTVDHPYSAEELSQMVSAAYVSAETSARIIGHRISVLGRVEKRFPGHRVFVRHGDGPNRRYSVTSVMKEAILNV